MDSFKRFKENKLPDKDCFFSLLKNLGISEKEYERAVKVWKVFKIKDLGEHSDLYLKTDVLLLCNMFEKFIGVCLKDYGLDPFYYFSLPGFPWNAMLKMTGVKLEKINDINQYLYLEKGMLGGISYISKRYFKSNQNTEIIYWDFNNLYGTIMSFCYLPYGGLEWLSKKRN